MTTYATYPHKTWTLGKFFIGTCKQAGNAPVIDVGTSRSVDGWSGGCFVIRLRATPGPALTVGRIGWRAPWPGRLSRVPVLGWLFQMRRTA